MKCPGCGGLGAVLLHRRIGLRMARCRACRLAFAAHEPAEGPEPYDAGYFRRWGFRDGDDAELSRLKRINYARLLKLLPGIRSVLDIGCGLAYSVDEALSRGLDAHGTEVNPFTLEWAGRRLPGRVHRDPPPRTFDAVTMIDVIEHVESAAGLLAQARRALAPGGRLLLTTPDLSSLSHAVLGARWPHFNREHLLYFDRATVRQSLRAAGFRVLEVRSWTKVLTPGYAREMLAGRDDSAAPPALRSLIRALPAWLDGLPVPVSTGDLIALARLEDA